MNVERTFSFYLSITASGGGLVLSRCCQFDGGLEKPVFVLVKELC